MENWKDIASTYFKKEFEDYKKNCNVGTGRRPEAVKFTTIENDVKRRDLTINALFYDIECQEVVDLVGGIDDLRNGIIRTVGDPTERFNEDRLRILRAIRFAARFGSDLDKATADAILRDNSLDGVSKERIRDEFLKGIASAKTVEFFIELLHKYDLMEQIFPGIKKAGGSLETRKPEFLIAYICQFDLDSERGFSPLREKLNTLCYSKKEVKVIGFLLDFRYSLAINNACSLRDAQNKINDDKILISDEELKEFSILMGMNQKIVEAYLQYQLSVRGGAVAREGFKGKSITEEVKRRETEIFLAILEKI